jgi:hypothetical protein
MASKLESIRDDVDPDRTLDARIRERAYHLWKNAGEPEGLEVEHWLLARQEIAGQSESPRATVDERLVTAQGTSTVATTAATR